MFLALTPVQKKKKNSTSSKYLYLSALCIFLNLFKNRIKNYLLYGGR